MKQDTPKTAKRREREKKTISQMIAMHCAGNHSADARTEQAFCGERVCPACAELDAYAVLRTQRCRKMDVKTSCEECGNHCYAPEMREKIRAAMRYSGPRMITKHPIPARDDAIARPSIRLVSGRPSANADPPASRCRGPSPASAPCAARARLCSPDRRGTR